MVLDSLKEDQTLAEISSKHKIDPRNLSHWRQQFLDNVETVFEQNQAFKEYKKALMGKDKTIDELHRQLGEFSAQLNWAKKKSREAGFDQ